MQGGQYYSLLILCANLAEDPVYLNLFGKAESIYRSSDSEDGLCNKNDVLLVPQVSCLEQVCVGDSVFDARLLESAKSNYYTH